LPWKRVATEAQKSGLCARSAIGSCPTASDVPSPLKCRLTIAAMLFLVNSDT
jgi:hypothetical protein